ncbi:unnamed protein product [Somion occarium]|uniref:RRM domain-containing protein n=1 Tax=Somion occarium TaxID=3059160 RepID=A0ABP1EAX7_9APHY
MVKLAEVILKKKTEFGPLSGAAAKNAQPKPKADKPSTEAVTKSKGKRKASTVDAEEAIQEKSPAVKTRARTKKSKVAEPVEKPTKKRKIEKPAEEDVDKKEKTPAKTPKKSVKAKETSKKMDAKQPIKSISSTTKAAPKANSLSKKTKKAAKRPTPTPSPSQSDAEDEQREDGEGEDKEEFFGFSTDDDGDSSDEDDMVDDASALDVGKLPTIAKDDAVVKRKLEKAKRKPTEDRGVIYLGRVPHGFYEDQMKAYFSQFGEVARLRLSRNKRTGKSKHYAFIEFDSSGVAKIVAETMDNYLLMGHILTCKVIPKDEVHPELWIGANRKWRAVPTTRVARVKHNKLRTEEEQQKAETRLIRRQEDKKRKLADAGIEYDFDAVSYKVQSKSSKA